MNVLALLALIAGLWLTLAVLMMVAWRIERRTGNSGWVDVVWTFAMAATGIVGAATFLSPDELGNRQVLILALVLIWSLRLGGHILQRTTTVSDDPRYAKLKSQWGTAASRNMFWLLQAQALLSVPMALAIALAALNPAPLLSISDWIALLVFGAGLAGSAISDRHLARFKQDARPGHVCSTGLWSWSRHPNYFFEWLVWVAFAVLAFNFSGDWNWGFVALVGPACMYWLLRYVSGVPPLEEHMLSKYGAAYVDYQASTSVFFPLPPAPASR